VTTAATARYTQMFQDPYWSDPDNPDWYAYPVQRVVLPDNCPAWVISGYDEVHRALRDHERLRKDATRLKEIMIAGMRAAGVNNPRKSAIYGETALYADAELHTKLRAPLRAQFTAARVEALLPSIDYFASTLIDTFPLEERVDLMEHYALPLPLRVICELVGIPYDEYGPLRAWTAAMMEDVPEITDPASDALVEYLASLMRQKAAAPTDDLFSALLRHTGDCADQLSVPEVIGTVVLMIVAGYETTTNAIVRSLAALLGEYPHVWARLHTTPGLVDAAVEESLRLTSPVRNATHRWTAEPYQVGNVTIPEGEIVLLSLASANRDHNRFPNPHQFDLTRTTRGHLAFGHGVHYCVGAALGRHEIASALCHLSYRFPHAHLAVPLDQLQHQRSPIMNGLAELPVVLNP
jgi:cytochrome P450